MVSGSRKATTQAGTALDRNPGNEPRPALGEGETYLVFLDVVVDLVGETCVVGEGGIELGLAQLGKDPGELAPALADP